MDGEPSNNDDEPLEKFKKICQNVVNNCKNLSPSKNLFEPGNRKIALRPSMVDRACLRSAVASSTPMPSKKDLIFTPDSLIVSPISQELKKTDNISNVMGQSKVLSGPILISSSSNVETIQKNTPNQSVRKEAELSPEKRKIDSICEKLQKSKSKSLDQTEKRKSNEEDREVQIIVNARNEDGGKKVDTVSKTVQTSNNSSRFDKKVKKKRKSNVGVEDDREGENARNEDAGKRIDTTSKTVQTSNNSSRLDKNEKDKSNSSNDPEDSDDQILLLDDKIMLSTRDETPQSKKKESRKNRKLNTTSKTVQTSGNITRRSPNKATNISTHSIDSDAQFSVLDEVLKKKSSTVKRQVTFRTAPATATKKPWRLGSAYKQRNLSNKNFTPTDDTDSLDETFRPKIPAKRRVFVNKRLTQKGRPQTPKHSSLRQKLTFDDSQQLPSTSSSKQRHTLHRRTKTSEDDVAEVSEDASSEIPVPFYDFSPPPNKKQRKSAKGRGKEEALAEGEVSKLRTSIRQKEKALSQSDPSPEQNKDAGDSSQMSNDDTVTRKTTKQKLKEKVRNKLPSEPSPKRYKSKVVDRKRLTDDEETNDTIDNDATTAKKHKEKASSEPSPKQRKQSANKNRKIISSDSQSEEDGDLELGDNQTFSNINNETFNRKSQKQKEKVQSGNKVPSEPSPKRYKSKVVDRKRLTDDEETNDTIDNDATTTKKQNEKVPSEPSPKHRKQSANKNRKIISSDSQSEEDGDLELGDNQTFSNINNETFNRKSPIKQKQKEKVQSRNKVPSEPSPKRYKSKVVDRKRLTDDEETNDTIDNDATTTKKQNEKVPSEPSPKQRKQSVVNKNRKIISSQSEEDNNVELGDNQTFSSINNGTFNRKSPIKQKQKEKVQSRNKVPSEPSPNRYKKVSKGINKNRGNSGLLDILDMDHEEINYETINSNATTTKKQVPSEKSPKQRNKQSANKNRKIIFSDTQSEENDNVELSDNQTLSSVNTKGRVFKKPAPKKAVKSRTKVNNRKTDLITSEDEMNNVDKRTSKQKKTPEVLHEPDLTSNSAGLRRSTRERRPPVNQFLTQVIICSNKRDMKKLKQIGFSTDSSQMFGINSTRRTSKLSTTYGRKKDSSTRKTSVAEVDRRSETIPSEPIQETQSAVFNTKPATSKEEYTGRKSVKSGRVRKTSQKKGEKKTLSKAKVLEGLKETITNESDVFLNAPLEVESEKVTFGLPQFEMSSDIPGLSFSVSYKKMDGFVKIEGGKSKPRSCKKDQPTRFAVIQGNAKVEISDETYDIKTWESFLINPGVYYSIHNSSKSKDLVLLFWKFHDVK